MNSPSNQNYRMVCKYTSNRDASSHQSGSDEKGHDNSQSHQRNEPQIYSK